MPIFLPISTSLRWKNSLSLIFLKMTKSAIIHSP